MRPGIILLSGLLFFAGCNKDKVNKEGTKSPTQLLTGQQWLLSKAGFDDNNNGVVDDDENILAECQKDDTYIFNGTGTGSIQDNGVTCAPPSASDFSWKFLNNEKELQINFQKYFVFRLNENELMLSPDLPLGTSFILAYRH